MLHEMGHLTGNAGHCSQCANTPMALAFDSGEWWHSPADRLIRCSSGTRSAWAASATALRRTVDVLVDERTFRAWDPARRLARAGAEPPERLSAGPEAHRPGTTARPLRPTSIEAPAVASPDELPSG